MRSPEVHRARPGRPASARALRPTSTPATQRRPTARRYMVSTTETLRRIMATHQRGQRVGGRGVRVVEHELEQDFGRCEGDHQRGTRTGWRAARARPPVGAARAHPGASGWPPRATGNRRERLRRRRWPCLSPTLRRRRRYATGCHDRPRARRCSAGPRPSRARSRPRRGPDATVRRSADAPPSSGSGRTAATQPLAARTRNAPATRPDTDGGVAGVRGRQHLADEDAHGGAGRPEAGRDQDAGRRRPARPPRRAG